MQQGGRGRGNPPPERRKTRDFHVVLCLAFTQSRCNGRILRFFQVYKGEVFLVSFTRISAAALIGLALLSLAGCGNTIRGMGRDVGNAVDATQDAGRSVAHSVD